MSSLLSFDLYCLSVNFFNTKVFEQPVSRRKRRILPLLLVSITVTQISEKRCRELVFIFCFNFLKSKVNLDDVPTNLGRCLFFFACCVARLDGAGIGVEPYFSFIALVVLLAFFIWSCIFSLSASSTLL